jgi:hypothetical protein
LSYEYAGDGASLPRYAVTPDGMVLLVDSDWFWSQEPRARLFDVPARRFRELAGPSVKLDDFTLSSDSKHAYVRDLDVFDIDLMRATTSSFELGFRPTNLNISADDRYLFLRKSAQEVCIFEIASRSCRNRFVSTLAGEGH